MTQEEKDLLIKDLSGRLPYHPIVSVGINYNSGLQWSDDRLTIWLLSQIEEEDSWEYIKPYLRPLSSITKEEEDELFRLCTIGNGGVNTDWESLGVKIIDSHPRYGDYYSTDYSAIDWLDRNMFDYRGLIPKGLALEAPEGMYNN